MNPYETHKTPNNEEVFATPGNRGPNDMKIWSIFPNQPWPTSLYYIGYVMRLKGMVEDRNYPNGYGAGMLVSFLAECILNNQKTVLELCNKYKIPLREKNV